MVIRSRTHTPDEIELCGRRREEDECSGGVIIRLDMIILCIFLEQREGEKGVNGGYGGVTAENHKPHENHRFYCSQFVN